LSATITSLTPYFCESIFFEYTISAMAGSVTLIILLLNYLKLESSVEKYSQIANTYQSIETSLEFTNTKLFFIKNNEEKYDYILKIIKTIEKKIIRINNQYFIVIPDKIKRFFPIICNINIFSFIRKTKIYKNNLIKQLRDIKNEFQFILHKLDNDYYDNDFEKNKEKKRLIYLYNSKKILRNEIIEFRLVYGLLDDIFIKEIKNAENNNFYLYLPSFLLFLFIHENILSTKNVNNMNPIIKKHLISIGLINE
jgi:hypothetical protein